LVRGLDFGELYESERTLVDQLEAAAGGDATNQAIVLSRLGLNAKLVCRLGKDSFGGFLENIIKESGADTSGILFSDEYPTSRTLVIVAPDGQRYFVHARGASKKFTLDAQAVAGAKVVSIASMLIDPFTTPGALADIVACAKESGAIICADTVFNKAAAPFAEFQPILSDFDYFFPNDYEAGLITGETDIGKMADFFLGYGVKNVIIKIGERGCFFKNRDESFTVAAYETPVVDTTGAGDNFVAGFVCALLDGGEHREWCKFGNATAGIAIQTIGANAGVLSKRQVLDFIAGHRQKL
jgi:sugar/nucleoside kinase (ribokinase family)